MFSHRLSPRDLQYPPDMTEIGRPEEIVKLVALIWKITVPITERKHVTNAIIFKESGRNKLICEIISLGESEKGISAVA